MNILHTTFKGAINKGGYNLADTLSKIKKAWIQGDLSDTECDELVLLAQENATPEGSRADLQTQIDALAKEVEILKFEIARFKAESGSTESTPDEPITTEYPAWYNWNGIGSIPWQVGSKCSHNGKNWVSQVADNIWEPGVVGVYSNIWAEDTGALV